MKRSVLCIVILTAIVLTGCASQMMAPSADQIDWCSFADVKKTVTLPAFSVLGDLLEKEIASDTVLVVVQKTEKDYVLRNSEGGLLAVSDAEVEPIRMQILERQSFVDEMPGDCFVLPYSSGYMAEFTSANNNSVFAVRWDDETASEVCGSGIETVTCTTDGVHITGTEMEYEIQYYSSNADSAILELKGFADKELWLKRKDGSFYAFSNCEICISIKNGITGEILQSLDTPDGQIGVIEGYPTGDATTLCTQEASVTQQTAPGTIPEIPALANASEFSDGIAADAPVQIEVTEYQSEYAIYNAEGKMAIKKDGFFETNDLDLQFKGFHGELPVTFCYDAPLSTTYTYEAVNPAESDLGFAVIWEDGVSAWISGVNITSAACSRSGVSLCGNNMEYVIKYYIRNSDQAVLRVSGSGEAAVCLQRTQDGFRFYSNEGAKLALMDDFTGKEIRLLEISAGQIGVLEGISKVYDAELYTVAFTE